MSNSAAVIGAPTVQTVTEDSNLQTLVAAGSISISDANAGEAAFKTTVKAASGDLGSLTIAASGAYVTPSPTARCSISVRAIPRSTRSP